MADFRSKTNPLRLEGRNRENWSAERHPNGPYEYQDEYSDPQNYPEPERYENDYDQPRPYRPNNYIPGIHEASDFSFGSDYVRDEREYRPSRMSRQSGARSWINVGDSAHSGDVGGNSYTSTEYDENPAYLGEQESIAPRQSFAGLGPQGYRRSDERILEDIQDRLTWDHDVDASNISVEAKNGEVTLKGTVTDRESKRRAEVIAESCSGVKDVQNQLRIQAPDQPWNAT